VSTNRKNRMSLIVNGRRAKMRLMEMFWLLPLMLIAQESSLDRARVASQAQSFAEQLPNLIGSETLKQRSITYSSRMRIRIGEAALKTIQPKIKEREIQSEIGYVLRGKDNPVWAELRKVISVDGKTVTPPKKARERLAFGIKTDDDRARLKMMEEFTHYGLDGLATDYSLTLLLFRPGEIDKMRFERKATEFSGADRVTSYAFARSDSDAAITVFDGKQAVRQPLRGVIWLRDGDLLPIKILLVSVLVQDKVQIIDQGTIEYAASKFGSVIPKSLNCARHINGTLILETTYSYKDFQKFGADAELKFTP